VSAARFGFLALLALMAAVYWSCSSDNKPSGPTPQPPVAPTSLYATSADFTTVTLRWSYAGVNIQGFLLYMSLDTSVDSSFVMVDSIASAATHTAVIDSLSPNRHYFFYVTAFNADGESEPSNIWEAATSPIDMPSAPQLISATAIPGDTVVLVWAHTGVQDHFVVQRHDSAVTGWSTVDSLVSGSAFGYRDGTVTPGVHYYYRVGAQNQVGTVFSADSLSVIVPGAGAPFAPVNLHGEVHLDGQFISLSWTNLTAGVDSILVSRSESGSVPTIIATLAGSDTSYVDTSLHEAWGLYSYRLRAVSIAHGSSPWSLPLEISYRLCSSGVIPLCLANYWVYAVDTVDGSPYQETRRVASALFHDTQDYYLLIRNRVGTTDSLYYLHNDSTAPGCLTLHWPHSQTEQPQLMFKYPVNLLNYYYIDGDSVVITQAGGSKQVGDTVYTNVFIYERYFNLSHWIKYYVRPNDVGVIMEEEFTGSIGQPDKRVTRTLVSRRILN
jgi:hypothetical protein